MRTEAISTINTLIMFLCAVFTFSKYSRIYKACTVDRLPPGVLSIAGHEVDHVFDAVAVFVAVWVVAVLRVTLETLV